MSRKWKRIDPECHLSIYNNSKFGEILRWNWSGFRKSAQIWLKFEPTPYSKWPAQKKALQNAEMKNPCRLGKDFFGIHISLLFLVLIVYWWWNYQSTKRIPGLLRSFRGDFTLEIVQILEFIPNMRSIWLVLTWLCHCHSDDWLLK